MDDHIRSGVEVYACVLMERGVDAIRNQLHPKLAEGHIWHIDYLLAEAKKRYFE